MLKGFLIFIFISSGVALLVMQYIEKPQKNPIPQSTVAEAPLNTKDLVFYELKKPSDPSAKAADHKPQKKVCSTDLECETGQKAITFEFSDEPASRGNNNGPAQEIPNEQDSIKILIDNSENSSQKSKDEMYDLIDNLSNLQQSIENSNY